MKRLAILVACSVVASGGSVVGNNSVKTKTSVDINGCDFDIYVPGKIASFKETSCGATEYGVGTVGEMRGLGEAITLAVWAPNQIGEQVTYVLQYPLVSGGWWRIYGTTDGVKVRLVNMGTYTVNERGK